MLVVVWKTPVKMHEDLVWGISVRRGPAEVVSHVEDVCVHGADRKGESHLQNAANSLDTNAFDFEKPV